MRKIRMKKSYFFVFGLLTALLFADCSGLKSGGKATETSAENIPGLQPIDIKAPAFFWLLQPWKEGKLVTYDGLGRFAEISFVGANKMRIRHLVNFPRVQVDEELLTWPEAGLITGKAGDRRHLLAAIDDKKTKSHVPLLTWSHHIQSPILLDSREGLIGYCYSGRRSDLDIETIFYIYNYKEDKMVYESPRKSNVTLRIVMDNQFALSNHAILNGRTREFKRVLYNWRANEIIENKLTDAINQSQVSPTVYPHRNIHPIRRYLFGESNTLQQMVKITWDENYEDVTVTPLSYLVPEGRGLSNFILSADGTWGASFVFGYRGLNREYLYKHAFFHLDDRYPNGISMPVITEDYEEYTWEYSAFVQHPVHGMCFAQEWHKEGELYLRLYKMSDVLAEINRRLLEKANEIVK